MTQLHLIKYLLHSLARLSYILSPSNRMTNNERFQQCKCILATLLYDTLELKRITEEVCAERELKSDLLALTQDTIRIALNTAGYTPDSMTQFEQASAILDMAQELAALASTRSVQRIDSMWERLYTRTWEQTMRE